MIVIEIPENSNCPMMEMRVFHDLDLPQPIRQVRLERTHGTAAWYDVTGWTLESTTCHALAQKVDDSGEGTALLMHGGSAGLRFRPADSGTPWGLGQPSQWGEPLLIIADARDVRVAVPDGERRLERKEH